MAPLQTFHPSALFLPFFPFYRRGFPKKLKDPVPPTFREFRRFFAAAFSEGNLVPWFGGRPERGSLCKFFFELHFFSPIMPVFFKGRFTFFFFL